MSRLRRLLAWLADRPRTLNLDGTVYVLDEDAVWHRVDRRYTDGSWR